MRVLFTAWAWPTHVTAMLPLAWALRAAGHEVGIAVPPPVRDSLARCGLPVAAVGTDPGSLDLIAQVVRAERAPADGASRAAPAGGVPRSVAIFGTIADAMADGLLAHARTWRPDLVVTDPTAQAGPLVAAALGVPVLRHPWFADITAALSARPAVREAEAAVLQPIADRIGAGPVDLLAAPTVDPCPAALAVELLEQRAPRHPVRPVPHHGVHTGPVPPELLGAAHRPRVCITWGTTIGRIDPALVPAGRLARLLAAAGLDPVLVLPPDQVPPAGQLPPRAVVAPSARLSDVLAHCAALVGHGGAGTILAAVLHGLPQLHLPLLPDHRFNTARVVGAGVGAGLPADAHDDDVVASVRALLADDGCRRRAAAVAAEVATRPSPAEVARDVERLVAAAAPAGAVNPAVAARPAPRAVT